MNQAKISEEKVRRGNESKVVQTEFMKKVDKGMERNRKEK